MIKFFRKIRQNLLSEGKTGKYLKYAIGEIVLVVIGILIALGINDWNEDRKNEDIAKNYYQQIKIDLNNNIAYSIKRISDVDSSLVKYERYKNSIDMDSDISEMFNNIKSNDFFVYRVDFQPDIINSIIANGDIKLFNAELQELLTAYQTYRALLSNHVQRNQEIGIPLFRQAVMNGYNIGLANRIQGNPKLLKAFNLDEKKPELVLQLEGYLMFKTYTEKGIKQSLEKVMEDAQKIINLIDENAEE